MNWNDAWMFQLRGYSSLASKTLLQIRVCTVQQFFERNIPACLTVVNK